MRVDYSPVFEYRPTVHVDNVYGFLKEPGLDLGLYEDRLSHIVSYDPIRGLIVIDGPKATRDDIGTYELRYFVTFSNQTISWDQSYNFTLLVYADDYPGPYDPCEGIEGNDIYNDECNENIVDPDTWKGKLIEDNAGVYHPDAPIPTISYVSPSGLVTITWDREMQIPEELDPIALEKIGLRHYQSHTDFGKGVGRARHEETVADARALQSGEAPQKDGKKIKIVDALEVSIAPRDGDYDKNEEVAFSWTVENFEPYSLQLQLHIEDPSSLSKAGQTESLFVTFYDTSFFKAA